MNPELLTTLVRERQQDLQAEAERVRLVEAGPQGPNLGDRILARLGTAMVTVGQRLQARTAPPSPAPSCYCPR